MQQIILAKPNSPKHNYIYHYKRQEIIAQCVYYSLGDGVGVAVGNTLGGVGVGIAVDVAATEKLDKVSSHISYNFGNTVMIK